MKKVTKKADMMMRLPPEFLAVLDRMPPKAKAPAVVPPAAIPEVPARSIAAVHKCIQHLAAAKGADLGKDAAFIRQTATRSELDAPQAKACRLFVTRYRQALPPKLAAVALGEVEVAQAITAEPHKPAAKPPLAKQSGRPLTPAMRQARWRAARAMASIEVPGDIAERIRLAREARGLSTAELLGLALSALERDNDTAASNVSPKRATAASRNLRDK